MSARRRLCYTIALLDDSRPYDGGQNVVDDFRTQARAAFAFLEQARGFRLAGDEVGESSGDALVDFESPTLRVRVLRDRGQVFLDVAPAGDPPTWFDLPLLLGFLGEQEAADTLLAGGQRDVHEVAGLLRAYYDGIERTLGASRSPDVVRRLTQLRLARADQRFGGADR